MRLVAGEELTNCLEKVQFLVLSCFSCMSSVMEIVLHSTNCYFITGSKKSKPVKFSAEPDLPSDVCEHLLEKFIPPSIRNTKGLQQLFLRYLSSKA